jgi:hypothetical protein
MLQFHYGRRPLVGVEPARADLQSVSNNKKPRKNGEIAST